MKRILAYSIIVIVLALFSCKTNKVEKEQSQCGLNLTSVEISKLLKQSELQSETIYMSDSLYSIYDQINL
jgi:hypothetical protein